MLEFFLTNGDTPLLKDTTRYPNLIHPHWSYLTDRVMLNVEKMLNYYLDTELFVNNAHPINTYLKMLLLQTNLAKNDGDIAKDVARASANISRQCGITTIERMGEVKRGVFYGGYSYEALYAVCKIPNLSTIKNEWRYKTPIKPTANDDDLIAFYTFDGKMTKTKPSFSTYHINPITLVLCYKYWKIHRERGTYATSTQHYLPTFVFPRMFLNMLGLIVFNKFVNMATGKAGNVAVSNFKHPFYIRDYNADVNNILKEMLPRYLDYPTGLVGRFLHMLQPLRAGKTMREMLYIDNLNTRQSRWLVLAARLPICLSIIKILGQKGRFASNDAYNRMRILITEIDNNRALLGEPLPVPIQKELAATIAEIKALLS